MVSGSPDDVERNFRAFARKIETDHLLKQVVWSRRAAVIMALRKCPDVIRVIQSGSLARGTNVGQIHDIDLIVVFRDQAHPDWNGAGSAEPALKYMQVTIGKMLQGGLFSLIRDTELRNHVVKSTPSSSLGQVVGVLPGTPPIDVMPAIQTGSRLSVPERLTDQWIETDPERLIKMVAARQRQWSNFDQVVQMIKVWAKDHKLEMKSLAIEAMILKYLPKPGLFETMSCPQAVARFFEAAAKANITELTDPTGLCGEFDPDFHYWKLRKALDESAKLAKMAVAAELAWKNRASAREALVHPSVYWREIFGEDFPMPKVWHWSPGYPEADHLPDSIFWFTEPTDVAAARNRDPYAPPWGPPKGPASSRADDDSEPRPPGSGPTHPRGPDSGRHSAGTASLENTIRPSVQEVPEPPVIFG